MAELPTKEQVLTLLRDEPMTGARLRGALGLPKKLKMSFKQMLAEMVDEGVLTRTCHKEYQLGSEKPEESNKKVERDNRRPGARSRRKLDEVNERNKTHRGVLHQVDDDMFYVTDAETGTEYPMAHRKDAPGKDGDTISFVLYPHPRFKHSFLAKVDRRAAQADMSWDDVKKQFVKDSNLPGNFSKEIQEYINTIKAPTAKDFKGRVDYRKTTILCIDPEGAMDHDDAISVEKTENGYRLGVHIADVSYYVPEGSALDEEALERSYTQYLPWTSVPMIPDELSADICSLHEDVDRCAFTCMMELDKKANVISYDFHRSIVRITKSITYQQAMEMRNNGDKDVLLLAEVTKLLKKNRTKDGELLFRSTEWGCHFDEKGEPFEIYPRTTDESNSWVEECMLIANNCCAKELKARKLQGIYRIHEAPDTKDIMELYYMYPNLFQGAPVEIRDIGKPRSGDTNLNPEAFHLYEHLVKMAGDDDALMMRILRSMQKAHYDSNSFGHFALNWQDYAHFTSPIRRYADLWCHRELARKGKEIKAERTNNVVEVCDLISGNEIKNQKCERQAIKVCVAWILKDRIGETFKATVTGVEEWGIFVGIKDPQAEGLVRFRDIAIDDYFIFNPDRGVVVGRKSGKSFARGDEVEVKLLRVNPVRGEVDFSIEKKLSNAKPNPMAGSEDGIERMPARKGRGQRGPREFEPSKEYESMKRGTRGNRKSDRRRVSDEDRPGKRSSKKAPRKRR